MKRVEPELIIASLQSCLLRFMDATKLMKHDAGLYAIWGHSGAWKSLGLVEAHDGRPLYVGKSKSSFFNRPLRQHFDYLRTARTTKRSTSITGSSSPRRSLAALLRQQLCLQAIPRNPAKGGDFAHYGLTPEDDQKLTNWMRENLQISTWKSEGKYPLADVEDAVKHRWLPPLNLDEETPWRSKVDQMRSLMAANAAAWQTGNNK